MKVIGKTLKLLLCIVLVLVLLLGLALGVFTAAEYRPAETEALIPAHETDAVLETGSPLSIVSWNCGYGALGDNADFFMDGGTSVYTADRQRVEANLADIRDRLKSLKPDFLLLQELDINSSRSYGLDERTILMDAIPGGTDSFAYNFNTLFVPYPLPPMGHVESGLYTGPITLDFYGRLHPVHTGGTVRFPHRTSSAREIREGLLAAFTRKVAPYMWVRRLGVAAMNIRADDGFVQLDLFTDFGELEKENRMQEALVQIRRKYGRNDG